MTMPPISWLRSIADNTDLTMASTTMEDLHRSLEEEEVTDETTTEDILAPLLSNLCLFFLIFGISATVQVKQVRQQIKNKCGLFTGVCMQFLVMPLLGFISVKMFGFSKAMGFSLLVVTSSPGGSYSNWWCALFNADLALSVAMTTVSTILSMAMLPANLILYNYLAYGINDPNSSGAQSIVDSLDFAALSISLGVVLAAISTGLWSSYQYGDKYASFRVWASRLASLSGIGLILTSALFSVSDGGASTFLNFGWTFYAGTTFPCLLGILLATGVTIVFAKRITKPESVAISIECCYQNTGIALSVATSMYSSSQSAERTEALAVALFYSLVEAMIIGVYCLIVWKLNWTKAPAKDNLCVVVSKTYQVLPDDDEEADRNSIVENDVEENTSKESKSTEEEQFYDAREALSERSNKSNSPEFDI